MGLALRMAVTVTPPEIVGALVWWCVLLAVPVVLLRRLRRRRSITQMRALLRVRSRTQPTGTSAGKPATEPASLAASESHADHASRCCVPAGRELRVAGMFDPERDTRDQRDRRSPSGFSPAGRLAPRALEPLCRYVDFRRRLELAVSELERRLTQLPRDRSRIEPYPLTGERRNTLLIIGQTGVFVLSATYAPGHWDDVIAVNQLARKIQLLLPGYAGQIQPAICHPFTATRPRIWHRPDEAGDWVGAWLLGGDSVIEWLLHFGPEHGLGPTDLERFDQLTRPNWLKAAIPTPASWPPISEPAPPGSPD